MAERLMEKTVKEATPPTSGNRIVYDEDVRGFGIRITSAGAKAFILNYRVNGRERRITIGSYPDWSVSAARDHAKSLKREVDSGGDPMAERHADRAALTIKALSDRFEVEHLSRRRETTARDYKALLRLYILPQLGQVRVAELRHSDIEKLHRTVAKTAPYQANRSVAVLSKMLSLAVKWEIRTDNPARGIERAPEEKRERYLTEAEIGRLAAALLNHKEKVSVNAVRLLMLTGARRGETLAAKWTEIDLEANVWVKPSAHTKSKKVHRVPLSAAAVELLSQMRADAEDEAVYVFPGQPKKPLTDIKRVWASVCETAKLGAAVEKLTKAGKPVLDKDGKPVIKWQSSVRLHDLRHTYASILASSGLSLPIIGALLGHTQTATTQRYAHLLDDTLRAATERVGVMVSRGKTAGRDNG